jgi:hypothetical protein
MRLNELSVDADTDPHHEPSARDLEARPCPPTQSAATEHAVMSSSRPRAMHRTMPAAPHPTCLACPVDASRPDHAQDARELEEQRCLKTSTSCPGRARRIRAPVRATT